MPAPLIRQAAEAGYYRAAIADLHHKFSTQFQTSLHQTQPEGYSFTQAFFDQRRLSRILAKAVAGSAYRFSPAALRTILLDKQRVVFRFSLMDRIVHGAVYRMLAEHVLPQLPRTLYAYVKGRNRLQAMQDFAAFARRHRAVYADPKARGLYVLRCDIRAYGESIPVAPCSPLWAQLDALCAPAPEERVLLEQLIRPVIMHPDGGEYQLLRGIPDGAPISALLLNLYALPLDRLLGETEGGFYARYGDDILFAHPDAQRFKNAVAAVDDVLAALSLTRNAQKTKTLFFNGAGRDAGGFAGTTRIDYLGCSMDFRGAISLKQDKLKLLMRDLSTRAHASAKAMQTLPFEERGKALCRLLSNAIDPHAPHAHPYAGLLNYLVNDRAQLKRLDYWLARLVLRVMLHDSSVKGFRRIPYRTIRARWRLRSLTYARNR